MYGASNNLTTLRRILPLVLLAVATIACVRSQPEIIVITATFAPPTPPTISLAFPTQAVSQAQIEPTVPDFIQVPPQPQQTRVYVVQPGDTLTGIAAANGITLPTLLELNPLQNPNLVEIGQLIQLPPLPSETGSSFLMMSDARLIRGPGSSAFDVAEFIQQQPGYIRSATDLVDRDLLTAAQIVNRVALEYSVDPRVLLALLEFKAGWLTDADPTEDLRVYPMRIGASPLGFDRNGLYRQLTWAADRLNFGYYSWKFEARPSFELLDGRQLLYHPSLNAGTAALQYLLSLTSDYPTWTRSVEANGVVEVYRRYFGDPLENVSLSLVPGLLTQPEFALPFERGQTWYFTGGPHGGWGSGSAWAAIDFAPPDDLANVTSSCYLSSFYVTAVADGVIARTDIGTVVLDLDGDGDESTGWTVLYLHVDETGRIAEGSRVRLGHRLGRPSCEGGFSNGTHVHIARRFNGEWIPADCRGCEGENARPIFDLGGWQAVALPAQEYQGFLVRDGQRRVAEQGRGVAENEIGW